MRTDSSGGPPSCQPAATRSRRSFRAPHEHATTRAGQPSRRELRRARARAAAHAYRERRGPLPALEAAAAANSYPLFTWRNDPLELAAEKGERCDCGVTRWQRLEDGRWLARYLPGRKKPCQRCGRLLRLRYWRGYGLVLAAEHRLFRLVVTNEEAASRRVSGLRPRILRTGHQALFIPAPYGLKVCYTSSPVEGGREVTDVAAALARDLAAMPDDSRRISATPEWQEAWNAYRDREEPAEPPEGEYLGVTRLPLERQRMVAEALGLYLGGLRDGEGLVLRPPGELEGKLRKMLRLQVARQAEPEQAAAG